MPAIAFKITATDKRHKAHPHFKWMVEHPSAHTLRSANTDAVVKFSDIRQWCVDSWGSSVEIDMWKFLAIRPPGNVHVQNKHWCYDVNTTNVPQMKLYFRTDAELAFYKLKWS